MTYEVVPAGSVVRAYQRGAIPDHIISLLFEYIDGPLSEHPKRLGKPLEPPLDGKWSARLGDWRAIYTVDDQAMIVRILAVKRRADAYHV